MKDCIKIKMLMVKKVDNCLKVGDTFIKTVSVIAQCIAESVNKLFLS